MGIGIVNWNRTMAQMRSDDMDRFLAGLIDKCERYPNKGHNESQAAVYAKIHEHLVAARALAQRLMHPDDLLHI
jgi:hypothetical protein